MQVRIMPGGYVVPALIRVEIAASNKPSPAQYHLLKSKNDYESAAWLEDESPQPRAYSLQF
ncbi:hypothetical protein [Shinella zoogloeoides]|uniref:hypothetical protein n=1 Tax=Shinella TaxID=323620 RepID=UPI0028A7CC24|nr:hypothetical protein [Shinella zoogloeoides]